MECGAYSRRHGLCAGRNLTRVMLVPESQALQEWCAVGNIAVVVSTLLIVDLCSCGSSSSHDTDGYRISIPRDAREGKYRAAMPLL